MTFTTFLLTLTLALGCKSGDLSQTGAQAAVSQAFEQTLKPHFHLAEGSSVKVLGVVENKSTSTATADLEFPGASFKPHAFPCKLTTGKASFQRYNDGRWILTEIEAVGAAAMYVRPGGWTPCTGNKFTLSIAVAR
jgi:hypothetical protein